MIEIEPEIYKQLLLIAANAWEYFEGGHDIDIKRDLIEELNELVRLYPEILDDVL